MAEVWFYHLQRQPLEAVLPSLLLKTLERGWRAVVQVASEERMGALDDHLWTFSEESFLPHTPASDANAASQPVVLTLQDDNTNAADVRFLTEGSKLPQDMTAYQRIIIIFNGNDPELLALAREQWKAVKAQNLEASYWQQDDDGRWGKKA